MELTPLGLPHHSRRPRENLPGPVTGYGGGDELPLTSIEASERALFSWLLASLKKEEKVTGVRRGLPLPNAHHSVLGQYNKPLLLYELNALDSFIIAERCQHREAVELKVPNTTEIIRCLHQLGTVRAECQISTSAAVL